MRRADDFHIYIASVNAEFKKAARSLLPTRAHVPHSRYRVNGAPSKRALLTALGMTNLSVGQQPIQRHTIFEMIYLSSEADAADQVLKAWFGTEIVEHGINVEPRQTVSAFFISFFQP
jgi:hypothetical protein